MKVYSKIIILCVVAMFYGSCQSDSDTDVLTTEEREIRTFFNKEWKVVEQRGLFVDDENLHSSEFIEDLFTTRTFPMDVSQRFIMGMNKKGEIYTWFNVEGYGTLLDFSYACTRQTGNRFTGYFNGITAKNQLTDLYIRQIDQETMKMVVIYEKDVEASETVRVEVKILKKIGPWDEEMSVKKIFEKNEYSVEDIERFGVEEYEREHGQGDCK
ncbi:hypothetical protein ACKUSY_08470 [Myroides odoratus]